MKDGVDGLFDEQRPGVARKFSDEDVESVIVQTLESIPKGRTLYATPSGDTVGTVLSMVS